MEPNHLSKFPGLVCGQHLHTEGNVIIVDVPITAEVRQAIASQALVSGNELILLDTATLSEQLSALLSQFSETRTLYVFPGNGAEHVQALAKPPFNPAVKVFAKRTWQPGSDPIVQAGEICPGRTVLTEFERVAVVDDVISSGLTMAKLKQRNDWKFPKADWLGACWIAQVPRMRSRSGVNGYQTVAAAVLVEGKNGRRAPINSLSTLVEDREIAESYATRHFQKPEQLLAILNGLQ